MAEALLKKLRPDLNVSSAGTQVINAPSGDKRGIYLKDTEGGRKVVEVLKEVGADASNNQRTQLTEEIVNAADRIIVMAELESIPDYLKMSPKMTYWNVADPKKTDIDFHRNVRDRINKLINDNVNLFE
jgi:protein-tyrosine-phosphatase